MGSRSWPDSDIAILKRLRLTGVMNKNIGKQLSIPRTQAAVAMKARELGLPKRMSDNGKFIDVITYNLSIDKALLDRARMRASVQGQAFSQYIANLIRRDLG